MKLVSYLMNGSVFPGKLVDAGVVDIISGLSPADSPHSLKEILAKGSEYLEQLDTLARPIIPLNKVKLLAPIPNPGKILALAGNYTKHIVEVGLKLGLSKSPQNTTVPRPFLMPDNVICGPEAEIPWPRYSKELDYELELCIVIGKKTKYINSEQALDHVAGYCIANDISARSVTFKANRTSRPWDEFFDWLNGKWADGFLPIGPYILTADEIDDVQNLDMKLTVNGQIRQQANTNQMIHPVADIVSFISNIMTLLPGDIIATGTPAGVGMADGRFLKAGDKIECTIEKLGTLTNALGKEPREFYKPLIK